MSHIYIQEPRTEGRVILKTSVGEIDVELWPKECPKATRNFVQLCLEGYYNGTKFHRVVKDFIAVGGDPTGTGLGGDSIYGKPFKDEFHSRLRFNRRGLLAMANLAKDDNNSQFFFTLGPANELQNKHTIFGKVVGDSIYNMIKLGECQVDYNEKPFKPPTIIKATVLENPFNDIVPRVDVISNKDKNFIDGKNKEQEQKEDFTTVRKDSKLLSFGEEDEEIEEDDEDMLKTRGKSKSSHVILDDPTLSSEPAIKTDYLKEMEESSKINRVFKTEPDSSSNDEVISNDPQSKEDKKKRLDEIHMELERIKQEIEGQDMKSQQAKKEKVDRDKEHGDSVAHRMTAELLAGETRVLYEKAKRIPKKGTRDREHQTLAMMNKFKTQLSSINKMKRKTPNESELDDSGWLDHEFNAANDLILARDANLKTADWYSIDDPRCHMKKKHREQSSHKSSHKTSYKSSHGKHKKD